MDLSELIERAEAAKGIENETERRVEMRAIYARLVDARLQIIEDKLGIDHHSWSPDMSRLQEALADLNQSFVKGI